MSLSVLLLNTFWSLKGSQLSVTLLCSQKMEKMPISFGREENVPRGIPIQLPNLTNDMADWILLLEPVFCRQLVRYYFPDFFLFLFGQRFPVDIFVSCIFCSISRNISLKLYLFCCFCCFDLLVSGKQRAPFLVINLDKM